ncbi:MAG TPA: hypothetical protein PLC28_00550 [Spirochaetota bacterium]|nr:hypothetical protein [Spirochaetota bacterium]HPC39483.1 hypothetical protein [Spirochaetota bacterium]HQF06820.1 hypothetical protein [Spirochaetota bacterium]HRS75897.1 hypothetical protein [Spirochaetota bacterium]HRT74681.1 hypothetical protein [Spirochaetota bacterium]
MIKLHGFIAEYPCLRVRTVLGFDPAQDFNTDAVFNAGIKKEFSGGKKTVGIADEEDFYGDLIFSRN